MCKTQRESWQKLVLFGTLHMPSVGNNAVEPVLHVAEVWEKRVSAKCPTVGGGGRREEEK